MLRTMLVFFVLLLAACARTPDEQAIRTAIEQAAQGAEAQDLSALEALLADDFIGNDELDRTQLRRQLRAQFVVAKAVSVRIGPIAIEVQGARATASFEAFLTDSSGRWIPERATTLHFETGWRRDGRQWHCINARWSSNTR